MARAAATGQAPSWLRWCAQPVHRPAPPAALALAGAAPKEARPAAAPQKPIDTSLDFELLGAPTPPAVRFDDEATKRRRTLLDLHLKVGLGLVALQLATTVVGQLDDTDTYGSNPRSPASTSSRTRRSPAPPWASSAIDG